MTGTNSLWRELLREATQPYACTAGIHDGIARCRNLIPCSVHPDGTPKAPRPDTVLVKINLNERWSNRFGLAKIPLLDRTPERARELAAKNISNARQLGRDAFTIRKHQQTDRHQEEAVPEAADSGCPVFGPGGITRGVRGRSIAKVTWQLRDHGFRLVHAHLLARNWKPPVRLVMVFSKENPEDIRFPWHLFQELTTTCFKQVDVWANGRDLNGNVVHTVNCGKREDSPPSYDLIFADGDWMVQSVVSAETER